MLQTLKNSRPQAGFTLVELLIVIVVIAILAAIAITAFSGVQAGARDSQRESDIAQVKQALEVYYQDEGYYPASLAGTADSVLSTLDGIEGDALVDPQADDGVDNSFSDSEAAAAGDYGYVATNCDPAAECQSYTLSYYSESEDTVITEEDVAGEEAPVAVARRL